MTTSEVTLDDEYGEAATYSIRLIYRTFLSHRYMKKMHITNGQQNFREINDDILKKTWLLKKQIKFDIRSILLFKL